MVAQSQNHGPKPLLRRGIRLEKLPIMAANHLKSSESILAALVRLAGRHITLHPSQEKMAALSLLP